MFIAYVHFLLLAYFDEFIFQKISIRILQKSILYFLIFKWH
jgi:hypothetical protein